jgi:hypothetical protein
MIGPIPGTPIKRSRRHPVVQEPRSHSIDPRCAHRAGANPQPGHDSQHAGRQDIAGRGENAWQLSAQEAQALPYRNATFQQEGADLIDDAGALTDQPLTHAVERLQIELLGGLGRDELHRRALHRLDRLRVTEVILLSLGIWTNVLRRHHFRAQLF